MSGPLDPQAPLREFHKSHDFFIGIDSDGCAFDTMEVKHKECFIPSFIKHYHLAAISKYVRETAEFVNLYSKSRGTNRFPGYVKTLDLVANRLEVRRRNITIPAVKGLRDWIARETKLANPSLKAEVEKTQDPDLILAYAWSLDVNRMIEETVQKVPPFPLVRESIQAMRNKADVMVISATPVEALTREWEENGLAELVALIAGQELGGKKEVLALAAGPKRYEREQVLMIGDAPGDQNAAQTNQVLFYPINPGHEAESWQRFHDEALPRFFEGTYAGSYQAERVHEFQSILPETPPWKLA